MRSWLVFLGMVILFTVMFKEAIDMIDESARAQVKVTTDGYVFDMSEKGCKRCH